MAKTILITGASGLIGRALTNSLISKGHRVHQLSRKGSAKGRMNTFIWDVYQRKIDENCIEGVDAIVHLAGENIAGKAWTRQRKEQIVESRTASIRLIYDLLRKKANGVNTVISASAIGYYGDRGDELLTEKSPPGTDFLSETCLAWENAVDEGSDLGLRIVKLRTGVVLAREGGALPQLARPIKFGLGSALGNGKQWVSWIHLEDVVRMYLFALENELLHGAYNMTAPNPVRNYQLVKEIASALKKPLWLPKVPGWFLKIILGEMSSIVLNSTRGVPSKIEAEGFDFNFPLLKEALTNTVIR